MFVVSKSKCRLVASSVCLSQSTKRPSPNLVPYLKVPDKKHVAISQRMVSVLLLSGVAPANQTKERSVHELFTGHSGTKVQCELCLFSKGKTPEFTKMGEIHEFFVLALYLVWFPGATPDSPWFLGFPCLFLCLRIALVFPACSFLCQACCLERAGKSLLFLHFPSVLPKSQEKMDRYLVLYAHKTPHLK